MNFDFSDDQKLLQKTARDYLSAQAPLSLARSVLESDRRYSEELWKGVAEMGWTGAAIPESYGGAGFGALELALIAEELGRALAPIPFNSSVFQATEALLLAGSDAQKSHWLPALASGERIGTFALAERAGHLGEHAVTARFADGKLSGSKRPVVDGDVAGLAVVAARGDAGISLVLVDLTHPSVARTSIRSLDPSRSQAELHFKETPAEVLGREGAGWALAEQILDRAAVLTAFEQLGGAQRALEITIAYTMGRYAFGRPVASFQAVKHRLADLYVKLELARSNAYYGAWALENNTKELATAACGARISASDAFDKAGEEMVQLHGGVGFTWEFDCHLFYRRAKLLGLALGSASQWRDKLIQRLDAKSAA